jgi:nucleoside-diphosphate-sugar epimerase
LVRALGERGDTVIGLTSRDGDIADPRTLDPHRDTPLTHVIHMAARTFVPDSWRAPADFFRTNVIGTANVLEFCRPRRIPLVFLSAYVYGQPVTLPIDESMPPSPNNPYALSKVLGEALCRFYAEHHAIPVTVLRPFNIYGPGQHERFLIPMLVAQAISAPAFRVKDLSPKRDWVYVEDLTNAIAMAMRHVPGGLHLFNIGSGTSQSVEQVIALVQEAAGTNKPVVLAADRRVNEITDVVADVRRAASVLGWRPSIPLGEGIRRMVAAARR